MTGLGVLTILVLVAILAPIASLKDPYSIDLRNILDAPSSDHILGTDLKGRDVWARLVYGARTSLSVGLVSVGISTFLGTVLGLGAGYYGGLADNLVTRLADAVFTFPPVVIVVVLVAIVGPSIWNAMLVIGFVSWPQVCRLVRAQVLVIKETDFIMAAHAMGVPDRRLFFNHILPNVNAPIVVSATFGAGTAILQEAALSFLGMGVKPPMSSWGNMLYDAQSLTVLQSMPWLWIPPGLAILITVLAINFVGDGIRDALDPTMQID
jgi:peptide/nickel transport system permease protein